MREGGIQGLAGVFGSNKIDKAKGISSHRLVELPPGAHKAEAMLQINSKIADGCQSSRNFQLEPTWRQWPTQYILAYKHIRKVCIY